MIIQQLRRILGNDVDITQYSEEDFNLDLNQTISRFYDSSSKI